MKLITDEMQSKIIHHLIPYHPQGTRIEFNEHYNPNPNILVIKLHDVCIEGHEIKYLDNTLKGFHLMNINRLTLSPSVLNIAYKLDEIKVLDISFDENILKVLNEEVD